ncbi:LysE family transporter [Psychroserpens ponticola]|uniref:LysE family transporter n=1 Tax=Psychroserpens ponticola TaxID=2932268 RepID=A0ABY7S2F0_9FLAO|nr:LysE family transporter [Psychroserpens ponticola]WCO02085.1 LysE family transporter [Psychroserpens ponticola]
MIVLYFLIGISASIIGALPLGASNIAVINTTIKQNAKQAFKIAIAAGIGEVILSYYALHCNMVVRDFFDQNMWIQILIVIILMIAGSFLLFKKNKEKTTKKNKLNTSKYTTGFLLGVLNPPVLIYWIVAFGIINNNDFTLSLGSPLLILFLFFAGVYFGKLITLYLYSIFSIRIKNKVQNITAVINKATGILLILIGIVQAIKLSV